MNSLVAFGVVVLALVGAISLVQRVGVGSAPAPVPAGQPTSWIQCPDGSIRTSCLPAADPPPPAASNPLPDGMYTNAAQPPTPTTDQPLADRQSSSGSADNLHLQCSGSGCPNGNAYSGPLSLSDGQYGQIPNTRTLRVASGDAAVIQAYRIGSYDGGCQVAGVIGPNSVTVTDGEYVYFSSVNASIDDLQPPLNEATQKQENQEHCNAPHVFVIH
jgi:hypothetical protein